MECFLNPIRESANLVLFKNQSEIMFIRSYPKFNPSFVHFCTLLYILIFVHFQNNWVKMYKNYVAPCPHPRHPSAICRFANMILETQNDLPVRT